MNKVFLEVSAAIVSTWFRTGLALVFVSGTLETETESKYTALCLSQTISNRFWTHSDWFRLVKIGPDSNISRVSLKAASKESVTSSNTHSSVNNFRPCV